MSAQCKSNVEHCYCWFWVYHIDISLSSVSSQHKQLGFFVFLFLGFFLKVIPYLKTVFFSIHADSGSLKMASVALLFHVKPRSELSVDP